MTSVTRTDPRVPRRRLSRRPRQRRRERGCVAIHRRAQLAAPTPLSRTRSAAAASGAWRRAAPRWWPWGPRATRRTARRLRGSRQDGPWRRADVRDPGGVMRGVTATADGFIAVGFASDRPAAPASGGQPDGINLDAGRRPDMAFHNRSSPIRMFSVAADRSRPCRGRLAGRTPRTARRRPGPQRTANTGSRSAVGPGRSPAARCPGVALAGGITMSAPGVRAIPDNNKGGGLDEQRAAMSRMGPRGPSAVTLASPAEPQRPAVGREHAATGRPVTGMLACGASETRPRSPVRTRSPAGLVLARPWRARPAGSLQDPDSIARMRLVREVVHRLLDPGRRAMDGLRHVALLDEAGRFCLDRGWPDHRRGRSAGRGSSPICVPVLIALGRPARAPWPMRQPGLPARRSSTTRGTMGDGGATREPVGNRSRVGRARGRAPRGPHAAMGGPRGMPRLRDRRRVSRRGRPSGPPGSRAAPASPEQHDPAGLEHVAAVGDGERLQGVLLDQQDRRALAR